MFRLQPLRLVLPQLPRILLHESDANMLMDVVTKSSKEEKTDRFRMLMAIMVMRILFAREASPDVVHPPSSQVEGKSLCPGDLISKIVSAFGKLAIARKTHLFCMRTNTNPSGRRSGTINIDTFATALSGVRPRKQTERSLEMTDNQVSATCDIKKNF